MTSKKISIDEIWKVIEGYRIKREMLEQSHTTEDILQLYQMIKKNKEMKRDEETIRRLREFIEKKDQ